MDEIKKLRSISMLMEVFEELETEISKHNELIGDAFDSVVGYYESNKGSGETEMHIIYRERIENIIKKLKP